MSTDEVHIGPPRGTDNCNDDACSNSAHWDDDSSTARTNAEANDLAYQDAKRIVEERTTYTDLGGNMDLLAGCLLWRLMEITDPDDFRRIVAAAVDFVTPDPS